MKIIVAGGGTVGFITAEYFMREGHDVTVIEQNPSIVNQIAQRLDVEVLCGKITDNLLLQKANVANAHLFLALTDDDEANIIACTLAKSAGVSRKICRLDDKTVIRSDLPLVLKDLGIDEVIDVEEGVVMELQKLLKFPRAADLKYFFDGQFAILVFSFGRNSVYYGQPLSSLSFSFPVTPLAHAKNSGVMNYDENVVINEFTYVYYAVETKNLKKLHDKLLPSFNPVRRVMIFGNGFKNKGSGLELANILSSSGIKDIAIVSDDEHIANDVSASSDFTVLLGDPSSPRFAHTELLDSYDAFVAISSNYEKNLFASLVADQHKVPYIYNSVRHPEHVNFTSSVTITAFINPGMVAANRIMKYHKADTIVSRTIFNYEQVECVEFIVSESSSLIGKTIKDLKLKDSKIVAIQRQNKVIMDPEEVSFQKNDVILLFLMEKEKDLLKKWL